MAQRIVDRFEPIKVKEEYGHTLDLAGPNAEQSFVDPLLHQRTIADTGQRISTSKGQSVTADLRRRHVIESDYAQLVADRAQRCVDHSCVIHPEERQRDLDRSARFCCGSVKPLAECGCGGLFLSKCKAKDFVYRFTQQRRLGWKLQQCGQSAACMQYPVRAVKDEDSLTSPFRGDDDRWLGERLRCCHSVFHLPKHPG